MKKSQYFIFNLITFLLIDKILPKSLMCLMADAIFGPPHPRVWVRSRSRRSRPDQVDYWEGVLHH